MRLSPRLRLGSSRTWLYGHIYGGTLFLLMVLMHTGFRLPTGSFSWWLWGLSFWTVLSGLAGLALQRWIPRVLASGLTNEVLYERIPELVDELRRKAEALMESGGEVIRGFYAKNLASALAGPHRRWIYYRDITGGMQSRLKRFHYLSGFLSTREQALLDELEKLYRTKLEIDAHWTLQQARRWWLYAHVPTSLLLLVLVVIHLLTIFYY